MKLNMNIGQGMTAEKTSDSLRLMFEESRDSFLDALAEASEERYRKMKWMEEHDWNHGIHNYLNSNIFAFPDNIRNTKKRNLKWKYIKHVKLVN